MRLVYKRHMPSYTLRRIIWPDGKPSEKPDFSILCDGKAVGRVYETVLVSPDVVWHWTVYGTGLEGSAPTLEEAKVKWKEAFESSTGKSG